MSNYYKNLFRLKKSRHCGVGNLTVAVFAALMVGLTTLGISKVNHNLFSSFSYNRSSIEAQEYASSKVAYLRAKSYSDLVAQVKTKISGTNDFYDEVLLSAETIYQGDSKVKHKVCTVNVYKGSDSLPCYSTRVTRLSVEADGAAEAIPAGSIIAWSGTTSNIPDGFALCNGSNGTPDLRDRFLVGAGNTYAKGATGGASTVTLTVNQVGNHYHGWGYHNNNNTGRFLGTGGTTKNYDLASGTYGAYWNGSGGGGNSGQSTGSLNLITSLAVSTSTPSAHENRPPYYALFFIMKLDN